ncbi:MAG: peptidylprolyl isomerase, partial [Proteobacteria bacterium]|nr:peptidylprolyl isomerase [Pseudomonadota bacterium]
MTTRLWIPALATVAALGLAACNKGGQTAPAASAKPPVATINGQPISAEAFAVFTEAQLNKKPEDVAPEQRKKLLESMEDLYAVAQEAEKQNVASDPDVAARIELGRLNTLASAAIQKFIKDKQATEADLKAEYDRQIGQMPKAEYHASHILVKEEAQAKDVIAQLGKGAKFDALAKKLSADPGSASKGGDLGWFTPEKMVPPFSAAVAKLSKGEYTKEPVQTQFGWHVIRLEDSRPITPPPFEQVKDRLGGLVQQHQAREYIEGLRKVAKIEETP